MLASCLLQVITDHLFYKGKISIYNLEWLIIPGAKGLYLSWMQIDSERTVAHFLQLAAACCPVYTILQLVLHLHLQYNSLLNFLFGVGTYISGDGSCGNMPTTILQSVPPTV